MCINGEPDPADLRTLSPRKVERSGKSTFLAGVIMESQRSTFLAKIYRCCYPYFDARKLTTYNSTRVSIADDWLMNDSCGCDGTCRVLCGHRANRATNRRGAFVLTFFFNEFKQWSSMTVYQQWYIMAKLYCFWVELLIFVVFL